MVVCPNPKCGREIGEPIIVTILSVTPQKDYEACPHCFTKLEKETPIETEEDPEIIEENQYPELPDEPEEYVEQEEQTQENPPVNGVLEKVKDSKLLKRVKALLPNNDSTDKKKKKETKELEIDPELKEVPQEETEPVNEKELEEIDEDYSAEEIEDEDTLAEYLDSTEEDEHKKETAKDEPEIEEATGKQSGQSGCPQEFGYLANRPKDTPIPSGCLTCPKMVDCMLSPRDD